MDGVFLVTSHMMENQRPNLIIISISMMYWFKTSVDCWKFDARYASDSENIVAGGGGISNNGGGGGSGSSNVAILNTNLDILYTCPLNSMCQCSGLPNETSTLIEINCNEVELYKFPEFLQSSVRYIEMSKTHLQNVDDETFQGLRLETLKLVDNKLQHISERSFGTMSHSLLTLDISGNQLQHLPLEALRNLHTLTRLVAQRNHITSLDGNWGSLCESLRSLHLSGNKITELSLTQINNDEYNKLNLSSQISSISTGSLSSSSSIGMLSSSSLISFNHIIRPFSKLRKLVWLDLSNNRIYHLTSQYLPKSLITLDLSKNLLTTFPQQIFEHLYDLRIISLRDNLIKLITFKDIKIIRMHLEKLDLGLNLIDEIRTDWLFSSYSNLHLRAINLEKNFINQIPLGAFRGYKIVHLVLAFNDITRIHIDGFDGIQDSLEYLDLERNQLYGVPGAIRKLNKLKYLYLTSNHISYLTNLPEFTKNLKVLSLSGNNFTHIPIDCLNNYTELSYLNMGYNTISEIPDNIFYGWGNQLQTILLRNNKITSLQFGSFIGLNSIKEISLSFNDIVYTNPYVFENISKTLKILELSFAMYRDEFPMDSLSPLTELMWLGLDNNNLKKIKNESLITMRELTYINLSFNQITKIPNNLFISNIHKHLIEIDLSYNLINNLTTKTFNNLYELQTINLQSNKIHFIEKSTFYKLEYLTNLDLSYNKIKNISELAFQYLPSLINLDLMHNNLCTISLKIFNYISNFSMPLKLNLSYNRINYFNDNLFSNNNNNNNNNIYIYKLDLSYNLITNSFNFNSLGNTLRILNLMSNNLQQLGNHAFGDLKYLEILNLSKNNITSVRRRSFQGLNNLQILDISYNRLEQLQVEQFSNLKKLRILKLQYNKLRALPREVFMNTHLEYLDISYNLLSVWPVPAFSDVGYTLRIIKISNNNIEYLDSIMFINSQFLYDLNLSYNKITVLPDNTFMFLNNLTNLDLSYNPLVTSNLYEIFLHTINLKKLFIKNIDLYNLPKLHLKSLIHLDLSNNYLHDINSFHNLYNLRILNISNNKITNASNLIENLNKNILLKSLDLSHNPIRRINFNDMLILKNLDELNLLDIKIMNPLIFTKLKCLKKLKITSINNNIGDIISRLPSLQELHINIIDNIINNDIFMKLINNTKLNLIEIYGQNVHTITSNAFDGLGKNHKLKIRLRNTKISDLPPSIFYTLKYIPHLTIDISDNRITALAADSFYPNITYWDTVGTRSIIGGLDTSNNPLECECGLVWFGHWLRRWLRESAQIKVIQNDEMKRMIQRARANTCHDPITGRKLPILEIFPEDLLCHASALSSSGEKPILLYLVSILPILSATLRIIL